ncbi:MAG: HupE/UreJ family protein [Spartobacteria bacterium]
MKRLLLALAFCCAGFSISAWAHDPGLSSANVTVADREITAVAVFNARDLAGSDYTNIAPDILRIGTAERPFAATVRKIDKDQNENVTFRFSFVREASGPLSISSGIIARLPFGHREFVSVHTDRGTSLGDRLLSARENQLSVSVPEQIAPTTGPRFADFFLLGIRHILTGYDHLLFLFGLLIVCRNARGAISLITCFTIAHSLTLALATFGLVNLQSRLVEPAIAASIVYVGIENLSRGGKHLSGRWILTFVFGLVHGLGFASVLRELGVASTSASAAVPLVGFNLGVEAGQLSIAAIILPAIWKLRDRASFLKFGVPACSLVVALAGGYWLLERTLLT